MSACGQPTGSAAWRLFLNTAPYPQADEAFRLLCLVSDTLSHAGFEVLRAHGGVEALTLARSERPDVILLDVMMPDLDGRDTCRALKMEWELQEIPVVLVSSADEHHVHWKVAGADAFLQKPFSIRALPDFVHGMLEKAA